MECLEGTTLLRELERSGNLTEEKVLHIGMELCSALEALEGAGLVHRDIKPANVMLEASGRVVLTDFGLGWRPSLDGAASVRSSGTPLFMAPEVLTGGQPSHASDLYALGVTLWWALAGRAPFGAKTLSELHAEAKRGPSLSLQEIRSDASESLVTTILWSMRPAAAERPGAASQLLERLRAVRDEIEAARRAAASASIHPASVAILPFANRSGNAEDEYFSDGLADELIHVLSKIKGIRVAARASSFHFRGKGARPAEIGRALRVATILDGSVRRVGSRVRISVQLVSAADGDSLWSESYDRAFDDLFAFQDDIARSVVRELRITLLGKPEAAWQTQSDVAKAVRGRANTPEAQRLYIHARHFVDRFNRPEMGKAIEYLREAVAIEPGFALAWAELARAYAAEADAGWVPSVQAYERSREAAQRALSLDPNLAEGHVRMGRVRRNYEHDLEGAKASYAMALELDPVNATALAGAGALCMNLAQFDDAVRYYERALDRDPLNAGAHHNLGMPLFYVGRLSDAEAAFRKALELAPQTAGTRCYLSWTLQAQGRSAEALSIAQQEPEEW
ncbi:MAG TPA: protein kinase, partial [Candidatus Eisenbacteria bacterium]|nr:protein kinase [Candidatus Eisenbacteria bacterium]